MIDKINDHFNRLKQDLANNFRQSTGTIRDSNELKTKIRNVLSELDTLQMGLDSDRIFDSFKNTSSLDSIQLIKYYDDLVQQELNKGCSLPSKITLNDVAFNNYDQDLKNLVVFQKQEFRLL